MDKLEALEENAWNQGFAGSGERELFLRESIAEFILGLIKNQ